MIGSGGLLAAGGVFGHTFQHRRLVDNQFARYFGAHGTWLWPAIAGAGLVVALICIVWLLRLLFSTDRAGSITVVTDSAPTASTGPSGGRTTLAASALTQAVSQEIQGYHGVAAARARIIGNSSDPTLVLDVSLNRRADLPTLVQRIEREAIRHAREALERANLPVKLDIAVTDKAGTRPT